MTTYQQWTGQGLGLAPSPRQPTSGRGFGMGTAPPQGHLLRLPGTQFLNPYAGAPPSVSPAGYGGSPTGYAGAYGSGKGVQTARTGLSSAPWTQQPTGYANPFGIPTQGPASTLSSPFAPITTLPQPGLPGVPTGPGHAGVTPDWPGQLMPTGYADPTLAAPGPWQGQNPSSLGGQAPRNPAPWGDKNSGGLIGQTPRDPAITPPTMEPQIGDAVRGTMPTAPMSMSGSSVPFWMQSGQSTPTYRTGGSAVGGVRG